MINIDELAYIAGKGEKLNTFQMQRIYCWANQVEATIKGELKRQYEQKYKEDLASAVDCFIIAIAYTLHFNEKTKFGAKRLNDFLEDLQVTVDMYGKKEYSPKEYEEILRKDGININVKLS